MQWQKERNFEMESVSLTYLGHSCFVIEKDGFRLCIDSFCKVKGYDDISVGVNEVLCTHEHFDHAYREGCLALLNLVKNPFAVERITVSHDDKGGALRGMSDIILLQNESIKIAHFGDIGEMPNDDVLDRLSGLDVALVPVGGTYTIDPKTAKRLVDIIKPKITIPMHYKRGDKGFDNIAELTEFTSLFDNVTDNGTATIEFPTKERGVVVLTLQ